MMNHAKCGQSRCDEDKDDRLERQFSIRRLRLEASPEANGVNFALRDKPKPEECDYKCRKEDCAEGHSQLASNPGATEQHCCRNGQQDRGSKEDDLIDDALRGLTSRFNGGRHIVAALGTQTSVGTQGLREFIDANGLTRG